MGIDATTKIPPETSREWGKPIVMDPEIIERVTRRWREYGFPP
jgi:4-hydroxy-3-polyprenylbenzoate decarboxylase